MRIGIVSAHYMPEIGYQEVHLAKAYARMGYTVKVFTSAARVNLGGSINKLKYKTGTTKDPKYNYEIIRLHSLSFKSKVLPLGLKKSVTNFNPDLIIILGVAKIFPIALLSKNFLGKVKMVSVYGDAKEYLDRGSFSQKVKTLIHEIGYSVIKYPLYRKALKYCDRLILNIPETNHLFLNFLNKKDSIKFEEKKLMLTLGYDPDEYFFNENDRQQVRQELGFDDKEIVIVTSTRINKRKNLEKIIQLITALNVKGINTSYLLIGFLGDDYEKELKSFIAQQNYPHKFKCFPFLKSHEIRKMYCAADAGIWLKAAISIQEAMGTGLPIILENKPSVNHLIEDTKNGWFFTKDTLSNTIESAVNELKSHKFSKTDLVSHNSRKLSYDTIAQKIVESVSK